MAKITKQTAKSLLQAGVNKAWIKKNLNPAALANKVVNQVSSQIIAYQADNGTAITLAGNTNTRAISGDKGNPDNKAGQDGNGNYYNQNNFPVNTLSLELVTEARNVLSAVSNQKQQAYDKYQRFPTDGRKYRAWKDAYRYLVYLQIDLRSGLNQLRLEQPQYDSVWGNIGSPTSAQRDWEYYTTGVEWPSKSIEFAIYGLASENKFAKDQAINGNYFVDFPSPEAIDTLYILAAASNGNQVDQDIIVYYTNGTFDTYTQSFTDWANNENALSASSLYPNEAQLFTGDYRNQVGNAKSGTRYMFGYEFDVDNTLDVEKIQFAFNDNVKLFAASYF